MTNIVYVVHPVSPEYKQQARAHGKKIIDARFAPKGASIVDLRADKGIAPKGNDAGEDKPLNVTQIKKLLAEKGIEIPEGVTKRDDLAALLDGAGE